MGERESKNEEKVTIEPKKVAEIDSGARIINRHSSNHSIDSRGKNNN